MNAMTKPPSSTKSTWVVCRICSRKCHTTMNCYNSINLTRFTPTHGHQLFPNRPTQVELANVISHSSGSAMAMWYPNSSTTTHISNSSDNIKSLLSNNSSIGPIFAANGSLMLFKTSGNSTGMSKSAHLSLNNILFVSESSKNLLSVNHLYSDNKVIIEIDRQNVRVQDRATKHVLSKGLEKNKLYYLSLILDGPLAIAFIGEHVSSATWHARLGHLHAQAVEDLIRKNLNSTCKNVSVCESCCIGKSHNLLYKSRSIVYSLFSLVFADIWGLALFQSSEDFYYYVNFFDATTNFNWIYH